MAVNKVVFGDTTVMDLTEDTVTSDTMLEGVTAHDKSGEQIVGSAVIPTVNNGKLTIQKNGTTVATFTANQNTAATANITVPVKVSELTNDSNFVADNPTFTEASSRANIASGETFATILGKIKKFFTDLKTVAFTGSYNDLSNKPTIPTVNNATLTIQKNGTAVKTFTANASTDVTANITVPTKVSELTNDSGYTTNVGTITGIKMNGASKGTSGIVDLGTVITAHQDISGKVNKSGDTMTGNLTIQRTGTHDNNYPATLTLRAVDSTNSVNSSGIISAYDGGASGSNMVITPSGNMFIGSGEGPLNHYNLYHHSTGEVLYMTSDNQVHIQANGQTIANRLGLMIDNSGNVVPEKADVATNNSGSIGTSSHKWANGYFTNINGVAVGDSPKFTDNNNAVTQTATGTNADYEVLFSGTADNTTRTEGARKYSNLKFNPSTGILTATKFSGALSGNADTASKLGTSNVGSDRQPIYLNAGAATAGNYTVAHRGSAGKSNMNDVARLYPSVGMTSLSDPGNNYDNPMSGTTKSTGWHLYFDTSYSDDPNNTNAWVAQICNKAGSHQWWVRSRNGGTITDGTAWTSPWRHLVTASQAGQGGTTTPIYIDANGAAQNCSYTIAKSVPSDAIFTDTTYSIMSADEGKTGTATTARTMNAANLKTIIDARGYTKNTGTVTKVSTGAGLTGGDITTSGTVKAKIRSETKQSITNNGFAQASDDPRLYPVCLDTDGYLSAFVPWIGNYFCTCETAAGTAAKVASFTVLPNLRNTFKLEIGVVVHVVFTNTNTFNVTSSTSAVTLNVNGTGAKNISYGGSSKPTGTNTTAFGRANYVNTYVYDGSYWVWIGSSADNNTTYSAMSSSELTTGTATASRVVRADYLKAGVTGIIDDWNRGYGSIDNAKHGTPTFETSLGKQTIVLGDIDHGFRFHWTGSQIEIYVDGTKVRTI